MCEPVSCRGVYPPCVQGPLWAPSSQLAPVAPGSGPARSAWQLCLSLLFCWDPDRRNHDRLCLQNPEQLRTGRLGLYHPQQNRPAALGSSHDPVLFRGSEPTVLGSAANDVLSACRSGTITQPACAMRRTDAACWTCESEPEPGPGSEPEPVRCLQDVGIFCFTF